MPGILRLLRLIRRSVRGPQHAPPSPLSSSLTSLFSDLLPLLSIPYLFVSSARILLSRHAAGTFLVLSRSPSKTNQIFGEVLIHPSQRRRRRPPGALNVTVSPHVENEKSARRSWLETLLYQFQTVATRPSFVWVFFFVFSDSSCLFLLQTKNKTLKIELIYI